MTHSRLSCRQNPACELQRLPEHLFYLSLPPWPFHLRHWVSEWPLCLHMFNSFCAHVLAGYVVLAGFVSTAVTWDSVKSMLSLCYRACFQPLGFYPSSWRDCRCYLCPWRQNVSSRSHGVCVCNVYVCIQLASCVAWLMSVRTSECHLASQMSDGRSSLQQE